MAMSPCFFHRIRLHLSHPYLAIISIFAIACHRLHRIHIMNPYYLPEIGYPFANGGYSSAGSAVSSPAPGPSNVPSAAASSTGYGSAHHTPHPSHHAHAAYGAAATAPPPAPAPIPTSGPLVHPHQDLNSFLESFWARQMDSVERETPDFKTYNLPLARIKKVMKSDEEVKMISAEAPIMFSKACESEYPRRARSGQRRVSIPSTPELVSESASALMGFRERPSGASV